MREIGDVVARLKNERQSILIVEQNYHLALRVADRVYVMNKGQIVFEGAPADLEAARTSSAATSAWRDLPGHRGTGDASMAWIDPDFPGTSTPSDLVGRVLGLNPGMMTGPGTNTYLVGRRDPILIDTGMGVPEYVPAFAGYLAHRGWARPARILLTHRHKDHLGGVDHLRERYRGLPVAKMIHKDEGLPDGVEDLRDGQRVSGDGVALVPVHTPGHASDHLCYYLPEERALFSGDLILNGSTSVIPDGDGDLGLYMARCGACRPSACGGSTRRTGR